VIGKVPQTYAKSTLYEYAIDDWVVRTTLTPEDLVGYGLEGAKRALRRVLAHGGAVRRAEPVPVEDVAS
jgi:hypothetical protein